jgi:hypothetical protein
MNKIVFLTFFTLNMRENGSSVRCIRGKKAAKN